MTAVTLPDLLADDLLSWLETTPDGVPVMGRSWDTSSVLPSER
jgi:hypothetical protein